MSTIFSLPTKSSTGFDNISSTFLKQIAPTIVKHLTILIKQVFNTGIFPDKLKLARVIPLHKKVMLHYLITIDQFLSCL